MTDIQNRFNRAWKAYTIMHLDHRVASVRSDGTCTIYAAALMPYNLYLEQSKDMDARVNNLNNFYYWCASRVLTPDRKYAKEILNSIGAGQAASDRDRAAISLAYHCVALTDVYWTRGYREMITFDEMNLFDHSLSDAFVDVSLRGKALTAQNSQLMTAGDAAGDVATQGVAPKAWICRNGTFCLLKDGDENEVAAELLASRIARCFDVDQVLYEPFVYDGQKVSCSTLMTSKAYSIVPMEHVEIYAANHDTDLYAMEDRELSRFRSERIGVVPQGRSAVDTLTVMENILLPQGIYRNQAGDSDLQAEEFGLELMNRMGVGHLADALAKELSGGKGDACV